MTRALRVLILSALSAAAVPALAQHTATISQQGSLGVATIEQEFGPFSIVASIFQGPGVGSRATIEQLRSSDAQVSIRQFGDRQTATVRQVPVDGGHVTVTQDGGPGNTTTIEQNALSATANVLQFGSNNEALITQNGMVLRADVNQKGTGNSVTVTTAGSFTQTVSADQRGANNRAEIGLNGPDSNVANLVQYGTDNLATIRGFGAQASISQDGAGNTGDISLNGEGSQGTIQQRGTANRAYIISVGDNNLATIRQGGQNNLARIDQNGSGLVATILQNTTSPGYGNVANIVQR
jgi:hypothetical protein